MFARTFIRTATAAAVLALAAGSLAACSSGGGASDGKVGISFLTQNDAQTTATGRDFIKAFEKKYPNITVKLDTQPAGSEGDNLMKTKLSTDTMSDVFNYNDGSLLQALNPDKTLVDLSGESWVSKVTKDFKSVVSTSKGLYGAPLGTSFGGGVIYNKKVFKDLGLSIPTSWSEFMANSQKIKAAGGITPILQAYGTDWTSQLFVLADFANVAHQDPKWATKYTDNKAKYVDEPALAGFEHQQQAYEAGLFNKDFASLTHEQALKLLADGKAAQYPMLTVAASAIAQDQPDKAGDIGFFALPADKAANTSATIWQPNALYIPKTTTGAKLDAAKKFVDFVTSTPEGCAVQNAHGTPTGPYVTTVCTLPSNTLPIVKDLEVYFTSGHTAPALEFLSPIKGPNLPAITTAVGSGISSGKQGAKLYDDDVVKQAQQLGLKGW
ncbi:ABC transporter substrate-binding protein [Lacisediminihabitans sp.]|uniref:ABC transporter substrate-binding protein n=1 Tax=Lacisediminihabitans sp. TaxID=2787631 RepID=UPI00374DEE4E